MEVLKIINDEKLWHNADTLGIYLFERLKALQAKSKHLGDVRGHGLMIGLEIVKNKETKEPCLETVNKIMEEGRSAGILFGKGGPLGNIIRIQPPLCINQSDADYFASFLESIL